MSVVRKYAQGGGSPNKNEYSDYQDFLEKAIQEGGLTAKGEEAVRKQLSPWINAVEKGLFNKDTGYYTQKPDETYEIKPIEGVDMSDLVGNEKAIKTNMWGKYNLKSPQEANTWIASINKKYLSSKNTPIETGKTSEPQNNLKYSIQNLSDYIKDKYYNKSEDYESMWGDYKKSFLKGDENLIRQDIMKKAAEHLTSYKNFPSTEGKTFEPVSNYDNLMKYIANNDWLNFKLEANKLGWNPEELASFEKSQEQINAEKKEAAIEETTPEIQQSMVKPERAIEYDSTKEFIQPDLPDINIDTLLPDTSDKEIEPLEVNNVVNRIYNDIKNGYSQDSGSLGQIKWLWKNKHVLGPQEQKLIQSIVEGLPNYETQNQLTAGYKKGGELPKIIFAQQGTKTPNVDKLKVKIANGTTLHNLFRTPLTTEKSADILSTAGNIASFIPGVTGVIGGLVTTGADIAKDIEKDGFQWSDIVNWNTAANIGFTGLAAIGGGGLRSLIKTAKAANIADKTIDVAKAVEKLGAAGKDLNAAEDLVKIANKIKEPNIGKISSVLEGLDPAKATKLLGREITEKELPTIKNALSTDLKNLMISENKPGTLQKAGNWIGDALDSKTAKYAGYGLMTAGAMPTVGRVVEGVSKEGKLGNIELGDIGNVAQFSALGVRGLRNKNILNAVKRQTTSVMEPAKYSFNALDKEGKTLLESGELIGNLPEKGKISKIRKFTGFGKQAATEKVNKEFNEKLIDLYNKTADTKLSREANISDIELVSPEYMKSFSLKAKPSMTEGQDLVQARKEYDLAKKTLEKHGLTKVAPAKTKKVEPEVKKPEVSKSKVKSKKALPAAKETPKMKALPPKSSNPTIGKPAIPMNKKGGILKAQGGTTLPVVDVIAKNLLKANRPEPKPYDTKKLMPMKTIYNSPTEGSRGAKHGWLDLPKLGKDVVGLAKKVDWNNANLLNSISYLSTPITNANIANIQKRAALSGIVNLQTPSRMYIGTSTLSSPMYEAQADKTRSLGNRLSGSTSDLDKRTNIMLSFNKQANDLIEKGKLTDIQQLQQNKLAQKQADTQWEAAATEATNKNKMQVAEANKAINLIEANKVLANNAALKNYLLSLNQNREIQERKDKYKNYFNLLTGPEGQDLSNKAEQLAKREELSKNNWLEKSKIPGANVKTTWEESDEAKRLGLERKTLEDLIKGYRQKMYNANIALTIPYAAKGGTLEDKKELIRYRAQLSKDQKEEEEFYKNILKNNELLLKSLVKVFK